MDFVEEFVCDEELFLSLSNDETDSEDERFSVRNENYLEHTVNNYSDEEYRQPFRKSRTLVEYISEKYRHCEYCKEGSVQYGKISSIYQGLIFLWFAGHQTASFRDVADGFDITFSSLYRIIRRVSLFLSNMSPEVIKWPDDQQKLESEKHFRKNGFPNVIGAIDGTHIKIDRPEMDPDSYINRKGYFSIQMQAVCDDKRRFIDVFIGYPGSVHDSRVLRNSPLFETLGEKCGPFFILGDSGYPLMRNLLTPYKDRGQLNRTQINYNLKLSANRYIIEHTFGILKQKFRQLFHVKLRDILYIVHFIRACCVLHNLCVDYVNLDVNLEELEDATQEILDVENNLVENQHRDNVANMLFRS